MKLVLFDCDGTLVDSVALIHEVMVRTFRHFGKAEPTVAQTKAIIGLTLDIAIARIDGKPHADAEAVAMMAYYKEIFVGVRSELGFQEPLFPGIRELIGKLVERDDVLIGAVTGKSRRGLDGVLETHGFTSHFFVSRTADDCPSKPHPAMVTECCEQAGLVPADTVVVGDAVYDMQMAKAAGAAAIGVSWGYADAEELWAAGADAVVDRPEDILAFIH
ncbi:MULTISPECIES: HAD-IA family hydrolase [Alphaproteobacteria]|uniref:Hydrolase n=2 Tax=Alphaproteobacteria TaxID=28211 RepID=A0A512HHR4_9HYPH|nr:MULTISPECIES: HAD-IA family hydrolase [Alphaproteobacteria]GEO84992.1 hydrolase [Ciceribacter naphthalenivorans]GLR22926.1 hydrolase [Ciceribacter naphthalenivorans]GLT05782.1 hydrolase [Sphingomonas psychrolutea]